MDNQKSEYHKQKSKEWREAHKDDVKEYNKTYYDINKEKIIEHLKQKVNCEACQKDYARSQIYMHRLTKKHLRNEEFLKLSSKI